MKTFLFADKDENLYSFAFKEEFEFLGERFVVHRHIGEDELPGWTVSHVGSGERVIAARSTIKALIERAKQIVEGHSHSKNFKAFIQKRTDRLERIKATKEAIPHKFHTPITSEE